MEQLSKKFIAHNQAKKQLLQDANEACNAHLPERIIQFGEGNFLRGFVDWMIHTLNKKGLFNGSIVAIQPTPHGKVVPKLNAQDGLYTLAQRGMLNGTEVDEREIVTSISRGINPYTDWQKVLEVAENIDVRFMFSNTTEAGLTYLHEEYDKARSPLSFPGKVTAYLYHRFQTFQGAKEAGMILFPCELLDNNGQLLKEIVIRLATEWGFPQSFIDWVDQYNQFCNTLVDRIVTGFPREGIEQFNQELGYEDTLLTTCEPFHLFAIEAKPEIAAQLPFEKAGLNVHWKPVAPFRELKVRILNGAHTMMFAAAYLSGLDTVKEAMEDEELQQFIRTGVYEEILPLLHINEEEKIRFADATFERFSNPFNQHKLLDISLNSIFKWKTRILPSFLEAVREKKALPAALTFSLAALYVFYRPNHVKDHVWFGKRGDTVYPIRENEKTLRSIQILSDDNGEDLQRTIHAFLSNQQLWETDLTAVPQLAETVTFHVQNIGEHGMKAALRSFMENRV